MECDRITQKVIVQLMIYVCIYSGAAVRMVLNINATYCTFELPAMNRTISYCVCLLPYNIYTLDSKLKQLTILCILLAINPFSILLCSPTWTLKRMRVPLVVGMLS